MLQVGSKCWHALQCTVVPQLAEAVRLDAKSSRILNLIPKWHFLQALASSIIAFATAMNMNASVLCDAQLLHSLL